MTMIFVTQLYTYCKGLDYYDKPEDISRKEPAFLRCLEALLKPSNPQCLPGMSETPAAGFKFYCTCSLALHQGLIFALAFGFRQAGACLLPSFPDGSEKDQQRRWGWGGQKLGPGGKFPAIWKTQPGTPEEAHMPKVSLALDDLSLCGAGEQSTGILCWVILGCMRRSQVWSRINLHSHKQMSKQAKKQAKRPGCNQDSQSCLHVLVLWSPYTLLEVGYGITFFHRTGGVYAVRKYSHSPLDSTLSVPLNSYWGGPSEAKGPEILVQFLYIKGKETD